MNETTAAPLYTPKATYEALGATGVTWNSWAHMDEVARDVACPIVAAELRHLAASLEMSADQPASGTNRMGFRVAAGRLRRRADEIERSTT